MILAVPSSRARDVSRRHKATPPPTNDYSGDIFDRGEDRSAEDDEEDLVEDNPLEHLPPKHDGAVKARRSPLQDANDDRLSAHPDV
jgi:hypothetical protein